MSGILGVGPTVNDIRTTYGMTLGSRRTARPQGDSDSAAAATAGQALIAPPDTSATATAQRLQENAEGRSQAKEKKQPETVEDAVEDINARLKMDNRGVRFRVDRESDEVQVQIVDRKSDKVIRSIPSDEMLNLSNRLWNLSGVGSMVDTSR